MWRRICGVIDYITILFVILDCYSVISIVGSNGENVKILAILFLIVSFGLHSMRGIKLKRNVLIFIIIYVIYQMLFALINKPSSIVTFFYNQVLIVALMMLCFSNKEFFLHFWEKYRNIMLYICCFSLVFYLLGTIFQIIQPSGTITATWGTMSSYKNWYYLYNEAQGTWFFGRSFIRNIGIFSESPMFSYCICFALWYEFFCRSTNKFRLTIYLLAIVTSFSITGALFAVAMFLVKYFEYSHRLHGKFTTKRLIGFVLLVVVAVAGVCLIFDKLDSVSGISRTTQYLNALSIWKKNFLFGVGYKMSTAGGFASGILLALVECGLIGCLVYFIPLFGVTIRNIRNRDYKYIAFLVGFAGILFLTVVPYKILTLCAVSYLWMYLLGTVDEFKAIRL